MGTFPMEQPPTPNASPGEPGPADPPVEALERELARARAELAEYQALIDELPGIYETKFRHQVHGLAQDIRRLLDERRSLQSQLDTALPPPLERPALPPASLEPLERAAPAPPAVPSPRFGRRPSSLRLRRWRRRVGRGWQQWRAAVVCRGRSLGSSVPERVRLPLVAVASALGVAALVVAVDALRRPPAPPEASRRLPAVVAPSPPAPPRRQDQDLLLRARGECWLEVQTLTGEVVYVATLQDGDQQRIRLRDGLRIRAGRPDLLDVAVGDGPFEVLNPIGDLGWRTFLPEVLPSQPAP